MFGCFARRLLACIVWFVIISGHSFSAKAHESVSSSKSSGIRLIPTPVDLTPSRGGSSSQSRAAALDRRRRQIRAQFGTIETSLPWAVLIVDKNGNIIFASGRAKALLAEDCGLISKSGPFRVERACVDRRLQDLILLTADDTIPILEKSIPNAIGVPDRTGQTHYQIKVLPYKDHEGGGLALIAIVDLTARLQIRRSAAATIFQLSDREAEFAEFFSMGLRISEIADEMKVAVNTARVHLRNVFQKTGCCNQIDLARKFTLLI